MHSKECSDNSGSMHGQYHLLLHNVQPVKVGLGDMLMQGTQSSHDIHARQGKRAQPLLELLLGSQLVGVATLFLAAVGGTRGQTSIALAANHLFAVELAGQGLEGGLDDATTQTQHQVQGGLLLDVVIAQGATILKLLAGKDEALLVGGDALLVLDLGLDIVNGVRGLDLQGDGLARQGFDENLPVCVVCGCELVVMNWVRLMRRMLGGGLCLGGLCLGLCLVDGCVSLFSCRPNGPLSLIMSLSFSLPLFARLG
jgi:hypothetical protein